MKIYPVRLVAVLAAAGAGLLVWSLTDRPQPIDPPAPLFTSDPSEYTRIEPTAADFERWSKPAWSVTETRGRPWSLTEVRLVRTKTGEYEAQSATDSKTRVRDKVFNDVSERVWTYQGIPPYRLTRVRRTGTEGPTIELAPGRDGRWTLTTSQDGFTHVREVPDPQYTLADDAVIELWLGQPGRKVGDRIVTPSVNYSTGEVIPVAVRVTRVTPGADGPPAVEYESLYADGGLITGEARGFEIVWARDNADLIKSVGTRPDTASWSPRTFPHEVFAQADIPDPKKVTRMTLRLDGAPAALLRDGPGQRVESGRRTVLRTDRSRFPVRATAADRERGLADTFRHPHSLPDVHDLARRALWAGPDTTADKVAALVKFVYEYITPDLDADPKTTPEIIRQKRGCCRHYADLFITLARSVGIPARQAEGVTWGGGTFGGHRWAEVVLDDGCWHPVDPTYNQTYAVTHIRTNGEWDPDPVSDRLDELTVEVDHWSEEPTGAWKWGPWVVAAAALLVGLRLCVRFEGPPSGPYPNLPPLPPLPPFPPPGTTPGFPPGFGWDPVSQRLTYRGTLVSGPTADPFDRFRRGI